MADYKIQLGVDLRVNDIRDRITQYNKNTNNAKLKLGVKLDTDDIKKQINALNLGGSGKGKGVAIPVNTQSLETSLKEVKSIIADIKTSIGSLDSGAGMKSLLSSINQISTALDKASGKFDELNAELKALSSKDFNINLGIDIGKKGLNTIGYGRAARKQVIPELESQIKYLENLFGGQQATMNRLASKGKNVGFDIFTDFADFNSDSAIKKMEAMEKYINSLKKLASIDNVSLDGFNEIHKDASELINDITGIDNAVDKAGDVPEKLKNLFGGSIDGENLSRQLGSIVVDLGEIKTALQGLSSGVSIDGLTQSFDKLSNSIEQLVQNCVNMKTTLNDSVGNAGSSIGQSNGSVNGLEQDLKQVESAAESASDAIRETANEAKKLDSISIDISDGDINDIKNALRSMNVDDSGIEEATKELNELNIVAKNVSATFKNGQLVKIDIKGVETTVDGIERAITATTTFGEKGAQSSKKYSQALNEVAVEAEKIHNKLNDTGANGFAQEVKMAHAEAQRFEDTTGDLTAALQRLDAAYEAINLADQAGDQRALVAANKEYIESLKQVQSLTKLNEQASELVIAKQKAQLKLEGLFGENSEAARKFAAELNRIQKELNECGSIKGVRSLEKQMDGLVRTAKNAELQTQTFGQKFKSQWQQYSSYVSVASIFMYAEQGLRSMFEQVKSIDSAMTELKKVTDETDASYNKFLTNAASRAKEIGTTIDGLVESTADFARLGYDFADAQGLAEVANIYAVVGDDIDSVEQATQSLISTLTAFKSEMNDMSDSDFALSIVDKMNEVANNYAISSGGIGDALQRSASSMQAANNTLDETIALITAAM